MKTLKLKLKAGMLGFVILLQLLLLGSMLTSCSQGSSYPQYSRSSTVKKDFRTENLLRQMRREQVSNMFPYKKKQ